jgi:hypothetical protein
MTKRRPDSASKRGPKPPKRHNGPPKRHNGSQPDTLLVENPETASSETALLQAVLPETPLPGAALPETALLETPLLETALSETALSETALPEAALFEAALPQTVLPETVLQNTPKRMTDNEPKEGIKFSYANATMLAYQAKLVEMAQANMQFAFEFAQRLATIRSPVEFPGVIAELTNKRIAMFWKHSTEMAGLSAKRSTS